jgi:hypothetical protein
MWRSRIIYFSLFALLCVGCGRIEDPKPRLNKHELQNWLDASFAHGKAIRFFSSNGKRMCCEYPNISVEMLPDQRVDINVDGWEPKQYTLSYAVDDDGKITLPLGGGDPFQGDVYVVREGSNILLTKSARPGVASPVTQGMWPLVFIPSGDWRPAPPKP